MHNLIISAHPQSDSRQGHPIKYTSAMLHLMTGARREMKDGRGGILQDALKGSSVLSMHFLR